MSPPAFEQPSRAPLTRLAMTKWGGGRHWEYDAVPLGEDDHGHWFHSPVGTVCSRPGRRFESEHAHVVLVPRRELLGSIGEGSADWVASFYAADAWLHTYVDITSPAVVEPALVTAVDLDLDVVRVRADDRVLIDDEDEFAEHRIALAYPPRIVDDVPAVAARVARAVTDREPPFDGAAEPWFARAAAAERRRARS